MVDQVLLARLLFGLTASFHIIFPSLIIGLAIYLGVLEIAWLRTKREIYRIQYQFWIRLFAVVFIIGMISGLVLSFELDTFFKDFYYRTAEILVPIRRFELANALILEAGALGIMLCGWRRVGQRLHLLATLMMVLGVLIATIAG
jgi:cytochrome d ubiquinol oxidase subunit I